MEQFLNHLPEYAWILLLVLIVLGVKLIRILTTHQQKMAQIIHQTSMMQQGVPNGEAMRHELELLKATVNHQTIMLDSIATQQKELLQTMKSQPLPEQRISL